MTIWSAVVGCLAALAATAAAADPAPASLPTDLTSTTGVVYTTFPPRTHFYPDQAARRHVGGKARIRCLIGDMGEMKNCQIISDDPPGYGFGAEALYAISTYFHAKPTTPDGQPTAGKTIVIPFRFQPSG